MDVLQHHADTDEDCARQPASFQAGGLASQGLVQRYR
jgi:hypothetical protein